MRDGQGRLRRQRERSARRRARGESRRPRGRRPRARPDGRARPRALARRAPPDDRLPRALEGGDPPARAGPRRRRRRRATWIRGRAWDQNRWTDTAFPTAADLEAAAPKTPVVLWRVDGHAIWVNARRAEGRGRRRRATADPPGGRIERLKDGSPAGVLVDNAMDLVTRAIPAPGPDEVRKDIVAGLEACAKAGLTGVGEASGSSLARPRDPRGARSRTGKLPIRVYATVGAAGPRRGARARPRSRRDASRCAR